MEARLQIICSESGNEISCYYVKHKRDEKNIIIEVFIKGMMQLQGITKKKFSLVIFITFTLFAFVDSAIYYFPSYANEGVSRDFYLNEFYYLMYVTGRGMLYGFLLNGLYFIIYFIFKGVSLYVYFYSKF